MNKFASAETEAVNVLLDGVPREGGHVSRASLETIIRGAFQGGVVAVTTMPSDFDILVARVVAFQQAQFPDQTLEGLLAHVGDELKEVIAAPRDKKEWADLFILFLAALFRADINTDDLVKEAHAKMDVNVKRKWAPADERGVYHHTEEGK
jgi:hypothetical protein